MEMNLEDKRTGECNCRELKSKCVELELEIVKKKSDFEALERKFDELEVEKIRIEDELKAVKRGKNGNKINCGREREGGVVDLTEEEEEEEDTVVSRLMIENKVLYCEKRKAETEVGSLKQKLKELESRVLIEAKHGNLKTTGFDMEMNSEDKKTGECNCSELKSKCVELELEIQKKKSDFEALEGKFNELEVEKIRIEDELKALKRGKNGNKINCGRKWEGEVVDLTEEEEEEDTVVSQLMIENKVLKCEKRKAETEVESLKQKLKELESRVLIGDMNLSEAIEAKHGNLQTEETPYNDTPSKHNTCISRENEGVHVECNVRRGRGVEKHLTFEEDKTPSKKMAPLKPSSARTALPGLIDISDSDEEPVPVRVLPTVDKQGNVCISTNVALGRTVKSEEEMTSKDSSKRAPFQPSNEENMDNCQDGTPFILNPKRKRASNIVTSDTESDEDDNIPIVRLKKKHHPEASYEKKSCSGDTTLEDDNLVNLVTPPRQRLVSLRNCKGKSGAEKNSSNKTSETKCQRGIPTTEDVEDDESEEAWSDSEEESMSNFIVDSSEVSDAGDASSEVQDESNDSVDYVEVISRLKRRKGVKLEWEFEADMLAAFGRDPELCMRAVCALYRRQTSDEKYSKITLENNCRGFSKSDAHRGTTLAEFLLDGDPENDLKKSVEDLQEHDPETVELCRTLATRYSRQLFEIYKNKEDPFFQPS